MVLVEDLVDQILCNPLLKYPPQNPDLLLVDDEALEDLGRLDTPSLLLRWANIHLKDVTVRSASTLTELISNPQHVALLLRVVAREAADISEMDSDARRWAAVQEVGVKLLGNAPALDSPQSTVALLAAVFLRYPHLECEPGSDLGRHIDIITEFAADWERTITEVHSQDGNRSFSAVPSAKKVVRGHRRLTPQEAALPGDQVDENFVDQTSALGKFYLRLFESFSTVSAAVSHVREAAQTLAEVRGDVAKLAVGATGDASILGTSNTSVKSCLSQPDAAKRFSANVREMMTVQAPIIEDAFRHWARGEPILVSFSGFLSMCCDCGLIGKVPNSKSRREIENYFNLALEATGNSFGTALDLNLQGFMHALVAVADSLESKENHDEERSSNKSRSSITAYTARASRLCTFLEDQLKPAISLDPEKRWPRVIEGDKPFIAMAHSTAVRGTIRRNEQAIKLFFINWATIDKSDDENASSEGSSECAQGRITKSTIVEALRGVQVVDDAVESQDQREVGGEFMLNPTEVDRILSRAVPEAAAEDDFELSFFEYVDAMIAVALVRDTDPLTAAPTKVSSLMQHLRADTFSRGQEKLTRRSKTVGLADRGGSKEKGMHRSKTDAFGGKDHVPTLQKPPQIRNRNP